MSTSEGKSLTIKEWLASTGRRQKWLAEELGCTKQHVSALVNGKVKPGALFALKLEKLSGGLLRADVLQLGAEVAADPLAASRTVAA